jgi:4-hydroxy-3-methylbut-2-enyl diphosphate reductase
LPEGAISLVENAADAERFQPRDARNLAYITQTTLSVDDTSEIVGILRRRFPLIAGPHKDDICYATTNRQDAIKAISPRADLVFVIGAPNSSNSRRLVEVATRAGARKAALIQRAAEIDWSLLDDVRVLGLSAGASAPELLVEEVVAALRARYDLKIDEIAVTREDVTFNVPRVLAS